jgi:hypothetical protein
MLPKTLTRPSWRSIVLALTAIALASPSVSGQQVVNLPAADRALRAGPEEVYRVGKIDGAEWEIFGDRTEVAFDGAGNLYVFDPTSHRVVVIGPTGRFLRQIGRRGDGPGELRTPMGFAVMRDGTVVVADMGHAAFLVFTPSGDFQRSVSFRGSDGLTVLGELQADPRGGSVLMSGRRVTMMQAGGGVRMGMGGAAAATSRAITRFGLGAGGGSEPLFTGWGPPPVEAPPSTGGVMLRAPERAFEPGLFAAVLPNGGLVVSDSTAYDLKVVSPDGRIERLLRRPIRPTPVTPQIQRAERDRRLAEQAAGGGPQVQVAGGGGGGGGGRGAVVGGGGGGGGGGAPSQAQIQTMLRQQIEQLQFYPELSVVTGLRTGWSGKIWASRRATGSDATARGPVDLLTAEGEYLGTLAADGMQVPDAFGPDGLAVWMERDRFETPIMVVRRLPPELR